MLGFDKSMKIGLVGEENAIYVLKKLGYKIKDRRKDEAARLQDIDFTVDRKINNVGKNVNIVNSDYVDLEVKTDRKMHKTGNMFIETNVLFENRKTTGWFYKTKAEVVMYYDLNNKFFYFVNVERLRNFVIKNRCIEKGPYKNNEDNSKVFGYLISIEKLIEEGVCYWGYSLRYNDENGVKGVKYNNSSLKKYFGIVG